LQARTPAALFFESGALGGRTRPALASIRAIAADKIAAADLLFFTGGMSIPTSSPLECRAVLALGGARSGKSRWAQTLAEDARPLRLFLATAEAGDEEMADRIARHRADRGEGWTTLEEPLELAKTLRAEAREDRVVLVDCVTLWLSNLMFAKRALDREIHGLIETIGALAGPVIFVSNEVGSGIAPVTPLGREFRDWQGRANQEIAAACGAVVLVTAGIPALIAPAPRPNLRLT
jgi:adenosylcobinamide kinase/adenosylcobinamide-phosphate guanylyltransferase